MKIDRFTYLAKNFNEGYQQFLENLIGVNNPKSQTKNNIYWDPDSVKHIKKFDYYLDLTVFLNLQASSGNYEKMKDIVFLAPSDCLLNDSKTLLKANKYSNFYHKRMITVLDKKKKKVLFRLRSDQLGFTVAPSKVRNGGDKYPVAALVKKAVSEIDTADKTVTFLMNYIRATRSLGGAFIWPTDSFMSARMLFNMKRGICSCIEDRVDATLLEVRNYYTSEFDKNILLKQGRRCFSTIGKWLELFTTFEEYIKFHCFYPFTTDKDGGLLPINLLNEDNCALIELPNKKQIQKELITQDTCDGLYKMLCRVAVRVAQRTKSMSDLLLKESVNNDNSVDNVDLYFRLIN